VRTPYTRAVTEVTSRRRMLRNGGRLGRDGQSRLGVNLETGKALGLTIPQSILLRADQVLD
jgi:hypothetical protein